MPESCPDMAVDGDQLGVHYTVSASNEHNTQGYLYSNGKKFDSSLDRHRIFPVTLGEGRVIKGWEKGLWGMCVECVLPTRFTIREKRRLIIPAGMAYGNTGAGDLIPPGATLVFDVELIGIRGKGKYANKCSVCLNKSDYLEVISALILGSFTVARTSIRESTIELLALPLSVTGSFRMISRIHRGVSDVASVSTAVTTITCLLRTISFLVPLSRSRLDGFMRFSRARSSLLVGVNCALSSQTHSVRCIRCSDTGN